MLNRKKILLAITGGIAAYKTPELIRLLKDCGADVQCCLSEAACKFVTPTTCQTLSENPVFCDVFSNPTNSDAMPHITLAKWADFVLVAPASADSIAQLAHGTAQQLLGAVHLAFSGELYLAPAMNEQMWLHPATQNNIATLLSRNAHIIGPGHGVQACGDCGPGRMLEPYQIVEQLKQHMSPAILATKRILITAGPTREHLDPIRYFTNRSSGKMGYALAQAAQLLGAKVTLISGPTNLSQPKIEQFLRVTSAQEMHDAVFTELSRHDVFVSCAAIADYTPTQYSIEKIKKSAQTIQIDCRKTIDILTAVSASPNRPLCIGFAAETSKLLEHATQKLRSKRCDAIIANLVADNRGMDCDENSVTILTQHGRVSLPTKSKQDLAFDVWHSLADLIHESSHA